MILRLFSNIRSGSKRIVGAVGIIKKPGFKVTELAKAMSIHHSTASNMLDKLAKKGLIVRERTSQDQRVVTVTLTPDGIE